MQLLESILLLLLGAVLLTAWSRRVGVAYPVVLAIAGAGLALIPNAPQIQLDPELILALFVAPILLDAAFDTPVRDLQKNWRCVAGLVVIAVGLTTAAVALLVRWLVPDLPWPAAVALGAIVAPPDAVAATAILRRVRPPHRLIVILEGESLFNDATALLIYRLAVAAAVSGSFSATEALPALGLVVVGSVVFGIVLGWAVANLLARFSDVPSLIILQFITTFGVWLAAEHLHLSGIVTIVLYGMVLARLTPPRTSARLRVATYAVWDTMVFVLQTIAFILVGLQLRPIIAGLSAGQLGRYAAIAGAVLATVIVVRLAWVLFDHRLAALSSTVGERSEFEADVSSRKDGMIIAWSGMRGIVTLAAAYALPASFPYRDLILICALTVVVGTLVIQGLTLPQLLRWMSLTDDHPVTREFRSARRTILQAGVATIDDQNSEVAEALRREYREMIKQSSVQEKLDTEHNRIRRQVLARARSVALEMRRNGQIGDDAFHRLEEELDWLELGAAARTVE